MMTIKTGVITSLIPSLITGLGTYELLRDKSNHSLNTTNGESHDEVKNNTEHATEQVLQSYREYLISKHLSLVKDDTSTETLKNILLHRMFPHYKKPFSFTPNQMFEGSSEINFKGEDKTKDGKSLYVLSKNTDNEATALKNACISALNKPKSSTDDAQLYRLKAWCTIPTIKDVLIRHKFEIPKTDDQWKEILKSEWITNSTYHDKQSFLSSDEMNQLSGSGDEASKIKILKDKCTSSLNKPFTRTNFPAPKSFLNENADEFQETALFCTVPTTAEDYVKKAMQGEVHSSIPKDMENDYCHEEGKDINYYKNIKTTDPMGGKSFWCAVRMIYHKQTSKE